MHHFDRHAWIIVSQKYSFEEILLGFLRYINISTDTLDAKNDGELRARVYKELFGITYLIVVDDVWSKKVCDYLKRIFPKENNGSRVLLTTRLSDVAAHVGSSSSPPHEMRYLSENESWSLFEKRVFENEAYPLSLEQVGKKIVKKCLGLPLTIVVAAGLLKGNKTEEYWANALNDIGTGESSVVLHCSKVLSLSYDCLSIYLKPCFLYNTLFPEGHDINATQLIRLWVAEGFVKPSGSKCLEDLAEGYLEVLVGRSLLLVFKRGYNRRIKSIRIHDILRDIGTSKAEKERFHYGGLPQRMKGEQHQLSIWTQKGMEGKQRRLSIHTRLALDYLQKIDDKMARSLLIFFHGYITNPSPLLNFRLLRFIDAFNAHLVFKFESLIHLRYLAFKFDEPELPMSVFELQNLQTLIIHRVKSREACDGVHLSRELEDDITKAYNISRTLLLGATL